MSIPLITTEQAPSAKPISNIKTLQETFQVLVSTVEYDIPVVGFGGQRRTAPGVTEITSPIVLTNITNESVTVTAELRRTINETQEFFIIVNEIPVEPREMVYIPLNGQFLLSQSKDEIRLRASENNAVTAMISFTQGQAEEDDPFGNEG